MKTNKQKLFTTFKNVIQETLYIILLSLSFTLYIILTCTLSDMF